MRRRQGRRSTVLDWLLSLALLLGGSRTPGAPDLEERHRRADAALESFLLKFWSGDLRYLESSYPSDGGRTYYWTFAQGFDALLDGVERTGGARYAGLIETFFEAQERLGWLNNWYDDENWMALALIRAYDITADPRYLSRARLLYADIQAGWDTTCCGPSRGGIWWDKGHTQKATASNLGPVITGVRLHDRTGESAYLEFALQAYEFWWTQMVNHTTSQVIDHMSPDGSKVSWKFTYNEGLLLGAAAELYGATGESRYLSNASQVALFLLREETDPSSFGDVLSDGGNGDCVGACHAFKGVAFRYLALLHDVLARAAYLDLLTSSADALWSLARTEAETLFAVSWTGPPMRAYSEEQTASAVMALNILARKLGPYPGPGDPPGLREAEDATLVGGSLGAEEPGFTGWGYVEDRAQAGQSLRLSVETAIDGPHDLRVRYACGAGAASRLLELDGRRLAGRLSFPAGSSWRDYAEVSVEVELAAGVHEVVILHDPAAATRGLVNLDHLRLEPRGARFVRGDCNGDGEVAGSVGDAIIILAYNFLGAAEPPCLAACDADGDGIVTGAVSDAVYVLQHNFLGGPPPPPPYPNCGFTARARDLALGCARSPPDCP